ncbi:MAG TPA: tetratricopeptide repeat protein [Pyrinomonadaceae bacterium]|jgi:tetratricopeptide (TPR) repeat protein
MRDNDSIAIIELIISQGENYPLLLIRFQIFVLLWLSLVMASAGTVRAQNNPTVERLQRAAEMIRKGQLSSAEAELDAVLRQGPREANALNLLGVVRAQQHRASEAETLFLRAIETNKALLGAYLNVGQLYLDLGKPERALWAFTEAVKLAPDNAGIHFNLASLYQEKKEYALALEHLSKIPAARTNADQLFLLVKSHLGLGHVDDARALSAPLKDSRRAAPPDMAAAFAAVFAEHKLFDDAIEILETARRASNPSFALLYNLGASYYQKGEPERAEESYLAALSLKPDDVTTLRALASVARAGGNLEKSLSYLVRARKVAPDSPAVLYDFGWTALNMNLLYDALTALERLQQIKPDQPDYLYPLAIARLNNGESPRAQELINRYIQLRPQDGRGYYVLGAILYGAKKFPEARAALERSLALAYYPDTEYYLGMIAHHEGDEAQAISWLQRALKSDPKNSAAHAALGLIYAKEKDYSAARAALERAIELDPKNQGAHYQLGIVYARLGEKERSRAMFTLSEKLRVEQKEQRVVGFKLIDPPK